MHVSRMWAGGWQALWVPRATVPVQLMRLVTVPAVIGSCSLSVSHSVDPEWQLARWFSLRPLPNTPLTAPPLPHPPVPCHLPLTRTLPCPWGWLDPDVCFCFSSEEQSVHPLRGEIWVT